MSFLKLFEDQARYAKFPSLWLEEKCDISLDPWQREWLDMAANPPTRNGVVISTHALRAPRRSGKTTICSGLAAWWVANRKSVTLSQLPGQEPTRDFDFSREPTVGCFARTVEQASEVVKEAAGFLKAAGHPLHNVAADRLRTKRGGVIASYTATASGRGRTLDLAILDEAGFLDQGGDEAAAVISPMRATKDPQYSALCVVSSPGAATGLFHRLITEPKVNSATSTSISISMNPRLTRDFLEGEYHTLGAATFGSEYGDLNDFTQPPRFKSIGDTVFDLQALDGALDDGVEALSPPPLVRGA